MQQTQPRHGAVTRRCRGDPPGVRADAGRDRHRARLRRPARREPQGLRPTRAGGHIAVYDAVLAQLNPPLGRELAAYHRVRRARNAGDYREENDAVADDVRADHPGCQRIVNIAKRVIGQMPPF